MSSIIKKVGSISLNNDVDVQNVIHFGKPMNIRVSKDVTVGDVTTYTLFLEDTDVTVPNNKAKKNA